jgi:hypothetical protein
MSWVDWHASGQKEYVQPRNLGSAILHRGAGEAVVFVLNHYPEAARFELRFGGGGATSLVNLSSGERIRVAGGRAVVDIDRKCGEIYRVETGPGEP